MWYKEIFGIFTKNRLQTLTPKAMTTIERITKIFKDSGYISDEFNETTTLNDMGLDSLDTVELIMEVEKEFNISIPDNVTDSFYCIKDIAGYVDNQTN